MTVVARIAAGFRGAVLLAQGRPEGVARIGEAADDVAPSFWAAALCLGPFLALRLIDWRGGGMPAQPAHAAALELLGYVIGWAGYALLSRSIASGMDAGARWPRFIVAWNWCNLLQYLLLLVAAIPGLLGAPEIVSEAAALIALGWALWIEWYATRLTLGFGGIGACVMVALDVTIGILLSGLIDALTGGS